MQCQLLSRNVTSNSQVRCSSGSSKLTHSCVSRGTFAIGANLLGGPLVGVVPVHWVHDDNLDRRAHPVRRGARDGVRRAHAPSPTPTRSASSSRCAASTARGYDYDLYFQPIAELPDGAALDASAGLAVAVPAASVDRLRGAKLEVEDGGLVLVNPNAPTLAERAPGVPADVLAAGIEGDVAQRVVEGPRDLGEPRDREPRRPRGPDRAATRPRWSRTSRCRAGARAAR